MSMKKGAALVGAAAVGFGLGLLASWIKENVSLVDLNKLYNEDEKPETDDVGSDVSDEDFADMCQANSSDASSKETFVDIGPDLNTPERFRSAEVHSDPEATKNITAHN